MTDEAAVRFDFTQDELFRAFRLVVSDEDARRDAGAVAAAVRAGAQDWATSEQVLILISLGSESGNIKVERIRKAQQAARFEGWMQQKAGAALDLADLRREWSEIANAENVAWQERRASFRRTLEEQGTLGADDTSE
jgi:hypothetical protein